ncbi:MAG TPA: hypothetical protein HA306_09025 [Methanosarcina sp.]|nr:hypothetical protein [Methanosarcina sp.]
MGIVQVRAYADKTVVFDLAEDVEAKVDTELSNDLEDAIIVNITKNNFTGYLIVFKNYLAAASGDGPLEGLDVGISNDRVTVTLVNNSVVMFRASPMDPVSCRQDTATVPVLHTCIRCSTEKLPVAWSELKSLSVQPEIILRL